MKDEQWLAIKIGLWGGLLELGMPFAFNLA